MTRAKRLLDLTLVLLLLPLVLPIVFGLLMWMFLTGTRPFFYVSERMKTPTKSFRLIKLCTMKPETTALNTGVSGGDKHARITRFGHFLRRLRLDELPQIWNVLRGDMSFVGPRPPLRQYVEQFPKTYTRVLKSRPGLTGLATLTFHNHESYLLSTCRTAAETEQVYRQRCIPRKARLDLLYQKRQSLYLDLWLIVRTGAEAWVYRRQRNHGNY
jgi:lipopolysaccharide/colanic/teichoic acid biosynthesis glycosyltransferase